MTPAPASLPAPAAATGAGPPATGAYRAASTSPGQGQVLSVAVDALRSLGPVTHIGQGFLHSVYSSAMEINRFAALDPNAWRSSIDGNAFGSSNTSRWNAVQGQSVPTTLILSDMWRSSNGHGTEAPWDNWTDYRLWVQSTVLQVEAAGYRVDYWEIYNEPDRLESYYAPSVYATVTPARLLEQFLISYQAIESIDSSARIVGPSLASFEVPTTSRTFSLEQFLAFSAGHGIRLAALAWHYNGANPQTVVREAAEARRALGHYPQLGRPALFLNEYGAAGQQRIPGWDVAYLAALNQAGMDQANRSCWSGDCQQPSLDGLLSPNGSQTLPDYWVRVAYAQMKGIRIASSPGSAEMASIAAYDPASATYSVLLGRAVSCRQDPRCGYGPSRPGPTAVSVQVEVPWRSGVVRVQETRIAGRAVSALGPPSSTVVDIPVTGLADGHGLVRVPLSDFGDGDAEALRLQRAGH